MSHETFEAPELDQLAALLPAYDFVSFIAKGGMGAVYKARQRSLDRDVAIKILPRELGADSEFRQSFETEAKAMARLNHPNLVGVYDYGDVDGMPYIVMEFVNGKSLYHSAWNKAIDPAQAIRITKGICDGLGHAHEHGVIHHDIKPANIFLTPKADPKIGDFGLARPSGSGGNGLVMGTPGYSAPEFLQHPERADKRADVYAVGVILHELLTGQRPDPTGKTPLEPTGDARVDAIWKKAVHPNPAFRYADADAMAAELAAWSKPAGKPGPAIPRKMLATPPAGARPSAPRPSTPDQATDSGEPAPLPVAMHTGSNWSLVRNLLIIAGLVVLIGFTYKYLKEAKANRKADQARIEQEGFEKQQREDALQRQAERDLASAPKPDETELTPAPTPPEPKVDTPLDTLKRLRFDLAHGERGEMPLGTTRHGKSDFFLVPTPMTWHEAAAFAEDHGGHLPVITADEDVSWLSQIIPEDSSIWLGAGRAGRSGWIMVDGTDWKLTKAPGGAGSFAALDTLGLLRARDAEQAFPFVIQWERDGSNPAALSTMLRRTRETLESPTPVFPPGTVSLDARHFVVIPRALTRQQALGLAEQAGGVLAIPSTRDEASFLVDAVAKTNAPLGLWLGANRSGDTWKWDTNEPWDYTAWSDQANKESGNTGLVLVPVRGWQDADPDQVASGVIIEWSRDAESAQANPEDIAEAGSDLAILKNKATELIREARKELQSKLAANVRTFNWDLDVWSRGLNKDETTNWTPHVTALKDLVKSKRVPSPAQFGEGSTVVLSPQMGKICEYGYKKQLEYDKAYQDKLTRIRDAYTARLMKAASQADQNGQRTLATAIKAQIVASSDLTTWADSLAAP